MKHLKNYLGILSMLVTLMLLTIASCTPDAEKEDLICKVSVEISEGGIGVVSNNEVVSGGEVTLKAVPEATYRFVNWTVGGKEVSKENPYTTTITATTQFKANFEKDNYKITVTAGEGGTVKTTKEGELLNETEVEVLNGSKVTLTATPNEGYSFVNWTVNGEEVSKEATYTITVTKDVEYVANFITHKVTVIAGEGGTATASKNQVGHNGQVTLTATPQEGYSFVNWTVNGEEVSKEATYTITVTKDVEYVANFVTHKITVVAGEGGTAKASKSQVGHNGQVTLTATADSGYRFVNWTVNGEEVSTENPYTATITANKEFVANFDLPLSEPTGTENGYGYVDLGLPSGLKWATCNVGADSPEDYGDYFAWGETQPKDYYSWSTYKYCNGDEYSMTKYCTDSEYGIVDNKTTLELSDDAARVNWGGSWRMPTLAELDELRNTSNCTWTWTTQNGVKGYKVTSKKNGNSIFLSAAGYRSGSGLYSAGSYGYCRSSSLGTSYGGDYAWGLLFDSSNVVWNSGYRYYGRSVRAVCE